MYSDSYPMNLMCKKCGQPWGSHFVDECPHGQTRFEPPDGYAPDSPVAETEDDGTTYTVWRFSRTGPKTLVMRGVTLAEAQAWCSRSDTQGFGWFDGYEREADDDDSDQD